MGKTNANRVLAQLAFGVVCIAGPVLLREQIAPMPAVAGLFGMALGLVPLLIPTRPRTPRRDWESELAEGGKQEGLTPEQVAQLQEVIERRIRRPALKFRVLAACVLYLAVCGLFGAMLLVARLGGAWHPLLSWWTGGFLWGMLGSVVWAAIWGGYGPRGGAIGDGKEA